MEGIPPVELQPPVSPPARPERKRGWIIYVLLVLVLAVGVYFRFTGLKWDDNTHLHPDERFLTMVETSIVPVDNLSAYFDTLTSTLNPGNRGFTFFVYGTLPIFIVRYVGEAIHQIGYDQIDVVGRALSGLSDMLTVLLVFLIGKRLYNRRIGLLAAAFAAFSVLPIQLSHFFAVDTFTNFFGYLAVYFAVFIFTGDRDAPAAKVQDDGQTRVQPDKTQLILRRVAPYAFFGLALGMATASKIDAAFLAIILPMAEAIRVFKQPEVKRYAEFWKAIGNLALAGVISIVTFRVFQPYAFSGPGFISGLSQNWLNTMSSLHSEMGGSVDFPPALQWAARPVTYSLTNMVNWGLGLPLGLLACAAFLWMGWRILHGEWKQHLVLWVWTGLFFVYNSVQFTSSMRYQMLIYPSLAIIAAWAVFAVWDKSKEARIQSIRRRLSFGFLRQPVFWRVAASVIGGIVLVGTLAWAFAFTRIYTRPLTRVAASEWIYQNVPGPFNLKINTGTGTYNQPLPYHSGGTVQPGLPYTQSVTIQEDGAITQVSFPFVVDTNTQSLQTNKTVVVSLAASSAPDQTLATATIIAGFTAGNDPRGNPYQFAFGSPLLVKTGESYILKVEETSGQGWIQLMGPIELTVANSGQQVLQSLPAPVQVVRTNQPYTSVFSAYTDGTIDELSIPHLVDQTGTAGTETVNVTIASTNGGLGQAATGTVTGTFQPGLDGRGGAYTVKLDSPLVVKKQSLYTLTLALVSGNGGIAIYGSAPALESSWDDALPQPVDGYSPYDYYNGIYQNDLNFEMYWDDNADKLTRFETTLDQADTIMISSNRQWATTTRVTDRYPLTTAFYQNLIGCPADKSIIWCYAVAKPGMFSGNLGYKLVAVFQSNPNIGPFQINDQFAEEAFTVYDHPKVLIFEKEPNYSSQAVRSILGAVDLAHVIHVTPQQEGSLHSGFLQTVNKVLGALGFPNVLHIPSLPAGAVSSTPTKTLMLTPSQQAQQQAGGTWSDLFNWDALQNKYQVVGVILWYLAVALLGLLAYPLVRLAFPGLSDKGYPLARTTGMLLLSFIVWIGGSEGIPFSRLNITFAILLMALAGGFLAFRQRKSLIQEIRSQPRYFLMIEGLTLAFFLVDLLIRLGNPDLWHEYKGGEKPMDFSYLQAVIKSTTFPPYDPWFAGGYINYYYYGFVIVGVLVKWLGIVPSIAYNLILPTLFSMVAMGAFSFGWNITHRRARECLDEPGSAKVQFISMEPQAQAPTVPEVEVESGPEKLGQLEKPAEGVFGKPFLIGLASSIGLLIIGNLGTVRMIWQGFQRLAAPNGVISNASFFTSVIWSVKGFVTFLGGSALPYYQGDWYWIPSRVYPGEPITEFPFFTFLYADLHAHLIALGITILALVWGLSIILGRARWGDENGKNRWISLGLCILFGALIIGSLRPTNTWDYPTYLIIGIVALAYTLWRYYKPRPLPILTPMMQRVIVILGSVAILAGLSLLLFEPYTQWNGAAYNSIAVWNGARSPFWSYLTHWGVFLFIISTWMGWETYDWMRSTPMVSLVKLRPYQGLIISLIVVWFAIMAYLTVILNVQIAWLALLLASWAAVLIIRPGQPDTKRAVLFMTGTALVLTLFVELFVLVGDIGRQNTVFKFYFQAWTLFALSAAAGLGWLLQSLPVWRPSWRISWQTGAILLITGAALFPITAGMDKIRDRINPNVPLTLDGMAYMPGAVYDDPSGAVLQLGEDYPAMIWMQENVKGSPVIVEGNTPEYRWGSRFTVYTGLPGVVGWNFHQRQQRAILPETVVTDRIADIANFYTTMDEQTAENFLHKYNVQYIIVGQLERAYYPGPGLDKFSQWNGRLWQSVYTNGQTTIYKVLP